MKPGRYTARLIIEDVGIYRNYPFTSEIVHHIQIHEDGTVTETDYECHLGHHIFEPTRKWDPRFLSDYQVNPYLHWR